MHLIDAGIQIFEPQLATAVGSHFEDLFTPRQSYLECCASFETSARIDHSSSDMARQSLAGFPGTRCFQILGSRFHWTSAGAGCYLSGTAPGPATGLDQVRPALYEIAPSAWSSAASRIWARSAGASLSPQTYSVICFRHSRLPAEPPATWRPVAFADCARNASCRSRCVPANSSMIELNSFRDSG